MTTSRHAPRLAPGYSHVHFLLDLTIAGHVYRVADEPLEVTHEDGTTLVYVEGLDLDYEATLAWFADSEGETGIPLSLSLAVDWAQLVSQGRDLAAATGSLSRWVEGTTYGQRQLLLEGSVSEPNYGALGEPLSFSLVSAPIDDRASFPPADAVVDSTTWPNHYQGATGKLYPWVFGCAGWQDAVLDSEAITGSPALLVDTRNDTWLIAGHRVQAATVWWIDLADEVDRLWAPATVTHTTDGNGRVVATITGLDATLSDDLEHDIWISWAPLARGVLRVPPQSSLNDNETFTISDGTTSFVYEFNVSGAAVIGGGNVEVDVSGDTTERDVRASIVDAINGSTNTLRATEGIGVAVGTFAVVWITNTAPGSAGNVAITDTVASGLWSVVQGMTGGLDEDERGGLPAHTTDRAVEGAGDLLEAMLGYSTLKVDVQGLAAVRDRLNRLVRIGCYIDESVTPLAWLREHLLSVLPVSLVVGPDGVRPVVWEHKRIEERLGTTLNVDELQLERTGPVEVGNSDDVVNAVTLQWALSPGFDVYKQATAIAGSDPEGSTWAARTSYQRFGERSRALESDLICDSASAANVVGWMLAALALPASRVTYSAPQGAVLHLLPGDVVAVTDSELWWTDKPFHVVGLRDDGSGRVELTLRSIEEPSRT